MGKYRIFGYNDRTNEYDKLLYEGNKENAGNYLLEQIEKHFLGPLDIITYFRVYKNYE